MWITPFSLYQDHINSIIKQNYARIVQFTVEDVSFIYLCSDIIVAFIDEIFLFYFGNGYKFRGVCSNTYIVT